MFLFNPVDYLEPALRYICAFICIFAVINTFTDVNYIFGVKQ